VGGAVSWQEADRNNVDVAIEPILNEGGNCIGELIEQTKAICIEVIVSLQNKLKPIPPTTYILMPRPVGELFDDVTRSLRTNVSRHTVTGQNDSIHCAYLSNTRLFNVYPIRSRCCRM
jgi:hypothetical protein